MRIGEGPGGQPMAEPCTIALDVMGGDKGPEVVVPGAAIALERNPGLSFLMFGDEAKIAPLLTEQPRLLARSQIIHTSLAIAMDDKPSQAMRRGKGTSMWLALEAVKEGKAHAAVSAGNTGALMAMATLILRPLAEVERPALAAIWPTVRSECIVLDVGANIGATARKLCHFALMGAAMARALFHIERPTVGLLNVGVEDIKGNEEVKEAHAWLRRPDLKLPIDYRGFVEGDQIGHDAVDVVVVEGFAGNIALKTAEGTAKQVGMYLKSSLTSTVLSKVGAFLAQSGLRALREKMDPRRANGGTFLGLNGIVIKSHGGTDDVGFANAVDLAREMVESGLLARMTEDLGAFHGRLDAEPSERAT